jgi:hypothetical protein
LCGCGAWIPDGAGQVWAGLEKLNAGASRGSAQTTQDRGVGQIPFEYQSSPRSGTPNYQENNDRIVSKMLCRPDICQPVGPDSNARDDRNARMFPPNDLYESWRDYLSCNTEMEP